MAVFNNPEKFPEVVCKSEYPPPVKFFEVPFLLKNESPVRRKPYALSRVKRDFVEGALKKLIANGIIRESNCAFGSPIILVAKPNGSWTMCTGYRFVNEQTD